MYGAPRKIHEEAGSERRPRGDHRAQHTGRHGREVAGVLVRADEPDELEHHDERARRGLGETEADHHLAGQQPAVLRDGCDVHVRQDGVGAPERDQRRLAEEPPHLRQCVVGPAPHGRTATMGSSHTAKPTTVTTMLRRSDGVRVRGARNVVADRDRLVLLELASDAHIEQSAARPCPDHTPIAAAPRTIAGTGRAAGRSQRTHRRRSPPSGAFASAFLPILIVAKPRSRSRRRPDPRAIALTHVTSPCTTYSHDEEQHHEEARKHEGDAAPRGRPSLCAGATRRRSRAAAPRGRAAACSS